MAREKRGMITWKFNFKTKTWLRTPIDMFFPVFSDDSKWNKPEYYSTIQTVVVNKELFLLAREHRGMLTFMFDKKAQKWLRTPVDEFFPVFSDDSKWNKPEYYSTIKTEVVKDELFLFGREHRGMLTFMFDMKNKKWFRKPVDEFFPAFADDLKWNKPEYYATIQTAVADNKLFMFAREHRGMLTYIFDMKNKKWDRVPYIKFSPEFSDAEGWNKPECFSTIKTFAIKDKIFLIAREYRGLLTFLLTKHNGVFAWKLVDEFDPKFSDAEGWNKPAYYSTIEPVVFDKNVFLTARAKRGLLSWKFYKPVQVS
jgi:tRNA(Leu) C34 or U34 (ribose-2'-O)-methylase TrmL